MNEFGGGNVEIQKERIRSEKALIARMIWAFFGEVVPRILRGEDNAKQRGARLTSVSGVDDFSVLRCLGPWSCSH